MPIALPTSRMAQTKCDDKKDLKGVEGGGRSCAFRAFSSLSGRLSELCAVSLCVSVVLSIVHFVFMSLSLSLDALLAGMPAQEIS